ncbi:MAG TPA: ABC transporter ATP-binding protein, partial [Chloroflexia bacterium]|nr:ABC transporter ATP-binding protein [Chloroflexia bacterium]
GKNRRRMRLRATVRQYWSLFSGYLRPQRGRVLVLGLLLFGSTGLQLLNPQVVRYFIDTATRAGAADLLVGAAALFLGIAVLQEVAAVLATYVGENVAWTATNSLRRDLAAHCLRLDMSYHNAHTPGELIERIDGDVSTLANFFSLFALRVVGNGLLVVGILVFLLLEDWRISLALGLLAMVGIVVLNRLRELATPHWVRGRQASANLAGFLEERLAGTEDIRANGATPYKMNMLFRLMRDLMQRYRRARVIGHLGSVLGHFISEMGLAIGLGLGAYLYLEGSMSIGTVYMVSFYAGMLALPLRRITDELEDLHKAGATILRVEELRQTPIAVMDGRGVPLPQAALGVEFDRVSFGYAVGVPVLRDLSFSLGPGKVLGLLGRTGSGKTTVTRLLLRIYDPDEGAVRLGGADLRDLKLGQVRSRVGMVTQEVQLFHASVRDNLTFMNANVPDERLLAAIKQLGLTEWYERLPEGLDTKLAPSGGLSAGEAQLLAFTRVFLKDPSLVILDEASSRLDPATERLIERAVGRLLEGRTAIIVAHRLGTVQRADEIMILEQGCILEHGRREQLALDTGSRFSELLRTGMEEALA